MRFFFALRLVILCRAIFLCRAYFFVSAGKDFFAVRTAHSNVSPHGSDVFSRSEAFWAPI
jgi:hypothetical protein